MKALTLTQFQKRGLDGIALQDRPRPTVLAHQVLVRMKAAALNPADLHIASGAMKMMSPVKPPFVLGVDGAGVIEQVGPAVRDWAVGDEVFFYSGLVHSGTMAEFMAVDASALAHKPASWSFEHAAASALALLCANLALTRGGARKGQRVLIHGGAGAVGAAAIAWAKRAGAQVDTTASAADATYLQALGAHTVYDYKTQALDTLPKASYDLVLDGMGGSVCRQSLPLIRPGGALVSLKVMTGLDDMVRMGMKPPALMKFLLPLVFGKYIRAARKAGVRLEGLATCADGKALNALGQFAAAQDHQTRIARTFALSDAKAALEFLASGKARGKVVVTI